MKRLLCILSGMNAGGAETFLMKIYRNIDRTKYQMDFCINVREKCFYEDEINSLGGIIHRIPSKSENLKEFKRQLTYVIKNNKYDYVLRITSSAMGFMDLKIAKKAGARVCCARSSNSSDGGSLKSLVVHRLGQLFYHKYIDVAIAPSDLAAQYTFGKKAFECGNVKILHNAIDLNVYRYDFEKRNKIRQEFKIDENVTVIGHVGRFDNQKNHKFLAEIFNELLKKRNNAVLMLVGKGTLESEIKQQVANYGISDKVIFTGVRSDVPDILSSMDVFVMPSFYEGMPNTVIEAQATGLPCVIADTITRGADITGLVKYHSLDNPQQWVHEILNVSESERIETAEMFISKKYDIQSVTEEFIESVFY